MNQPSKVLIVEDQYFVAIDCEQQLRDSGFDCVGLATTAAEALELAGREQPDLVIMDIRLAGRADGLQAALDIYERFGIRCIFASAHADAATRREAERARPLAWLNKPYSGEELIKAVQDSLAELHSAAACAGSRVPLLHAR